MKLCRFQPLEFDVSAIGTPAHPGSLCGRIEGDMVHEILCESFGAWVDTSRAWPLASVRLLTPLNPSKIVCVGRNYPEHAAELGNVVPKEPLIFLKPPSSVIGPEEPIVLPPESQRVEYEGELAVVIGRTCSRLRSGDDSSPYVLGYTCLNDVTARDIQRAESQWTRGKGFDTFCPLGPFVETQLDLEAATIETFVNGARRQFTPVSEMVFSIGAILSWISRVMTLLPGDVVATGTPAGVGPLAAGDVVEVAIRGIGTLRNPVVAREK
jgi:2-keto-4-pentenoate hydratase/2-oxohepta-3-ene-1,7-dioic acid hydratase in catechol pathway